jgi:hypothetical protein
MPLTAADLTSLAQSITRDLGIDADLWPIVYNPIAATLELPCVERPRVTPGAPASTDIAIDAAVEDAITKGIDPPDPRKPKSDRRKT